MLHTQVKSQIRGCTNGREESCWLWLWRKTRPEAPIFEVKFEACSPVDKQGKDILGRETTSANYDLYFFLKKKMWALQIFLHDYMTEKVID